MNGMILKSIAGALALGLVLWGPGMPRALGQVEVNYRGIDGECREAFNAIPDTALREECVKLLETCESVQDAETRGETSAPEDKATVASVETTIEVVAKAGDTVASEVTIPDRGTIQTALAQAGVDPTAASTLAVDSQKVIGDMRAAFAAGDPIKAEAIVKSFQERCMKEFNFDPAKVFGEGPETRGVTFERFLGGRDIVEVACVGHFEKAFAEGARPGEVFREMALTGVSMEAIHGGTGGFEPPKEMLDAMTPTEKSMYEAWKGGDFAAMEKMHVEAAIKAGHEAGMSPEKIAAEIAHGQEMEAMYREMMEKYTPTSDAPRSETSGHSETQSTKEADGHTKCPSGTTHQVGVSEGSGHCL